MTDILVSIVRRSLQLTSVVAFASYPIDDPTEPLLECILYQKNIDLLMTVGLDTTNHYNLSAGEGTLRILGKLLEIHVRCDDDSDDGSVDGDDEPRREMISYQTLRILKAVVTSLPRIQQILRDHDSPGLMCNMNGEVAPRLGFIRLRLLVIISTLALSKTDKIDKILIESNILADILDIFFKYEHHSFMQMVVAGMMEYILEQGNECMRVALLSDGNLLERIVRANKLNYKKPVSPSRAGVYEPFPPRKPYMGQLTRISNALCQLHASLESNNEQGIYFIYSSCSREF
jgi:hypothetical protein